MRSIVVAALLLLVGPSVAFARPKAIKPVQMNIYDATGAKVGRLMDVSGESGGPLTEARTQILVQGIPIILRVRQDALGGYGSPLVFTSSDCTATPYLLPNPDSLLQPTTTVVLPGWTVYAPQPGQSETTIDIQSARTADRACFPSLADNVTVIPATALLDLSTLFTAPFSIH